MSVKTYGQIFQVLRGFIELGFKWVQTSSPMRANLKVQTRVPRRLYINPCSRSSLSQTFHLLQFQGRLALILLVMLCFGLGCIIRFFLFFWVLFLVFVIEIMKKTKGGNQF